MAERRSYENLLGLRSCCFNELTPGGGLTNNSSIEALAWSASPGPGRGNRARHTQRVAGGSNRVLRLWEGQLHDRTRFVGRFRPHRLEANVVAQPRQPRTRPGNKQLPYESVHPLAATFSIPGISCAVFWSERLSSDRKRTGNRKAP
jgi:hypothetical protein